MNRRTFLQNAALVSTSSLLPLSACTEPEPAFAMGLQLFGVREDMAKDPVGTLRAVKEMGYQHFEVYGFDAEEERIYGHSCTGFKSILDDLNLAATSGHFSFHTVMDQPEEAILHFTDQCISGAQAMGMPYITWPWMAPEQRTADTFRRLPDLLNRIGERVTAAGLGFAYHNHDFEFAEYGGENGYDLILRETDPELVNLQIDMYWVMHSARRSPRELIGQQPGRYVMWHLKDMHKESRDYTELGNGSIDYTKIMPNPVTSGLEYFYLEQGGNFTHSPLRSAADSAAFFQQHLRHLLP